MKRKNLFFTLLITLSCASFSFAQNTFEIDKTHSHIGFAVKHMVISTVKGQFNEFSGSIDYNVDDITNSSVSVEIMTGSVDTDSERRDRHLRSDDFFNAEEFPKITFKSKQITKTDDGFVAIGDLTIRDVTKEVEIPFEVSDILKTQRGELIGVSGELVINRQDYGVKYSRTLDNGGLVVSDEVKIELHIEARKRNPEAEQGRN